MGYGFYFLADGRPGGYVVEATCDRRGCDAEIDRGLGFLCGYQPHGRLSNVPGCGRYYCDRHLGAVGPRGACPHRGVRAWGKTLACMEVREDWEGWKTYCTNRVGHAGPHWADDS